MAWPLFHRRIVLLLAGGAVVLFFLLMLLVTDKGSVSLRTRTHPSMWLLAVRMPQVVLPVDEKDDTNEWKQHLFARLNRVLARCGALCSTDALDRYTVPFPDGSAMLPPVLQRRVRIPVRCQDLLTNDANTLDVFDTDSLVVAPPKELVPYYGPLRVHQHLNNTSTTGGVNDLHVVQAYIRNCQTPGQVLYPPYGEGSNQLLERMKQLPLDWDNHPPRVLVLRIDATSEPPWVEAAALCMGAAHVTSLLLTPKHHHHHDKTHPRITQTTMKQLLAQKRRRLFDLVVSFSSVDHVGLGRYGDMLNPWGDLLTMAQARCLTKKNGFLCLSVPMANQDEKVYFNDNRVYGPKRYPLLTANWNPINPIQSSISQPTMIFQNSLLDEQTF